MTLANRSLLNPYLSSVVVRATAKLIYRLVRSSSLATSASVLTAGVEATCAVVPLPLPITPDLRRSRVRLTGDLSKLRKSPLMALSGPWEGPLVGRHPTAAFDPKRTYPSCLQQVRRRLIDEAGVIRIGAEAGAVAR
jgi:hypothetical protein